MSAGDIQFYWKELRSNGCICGREKKPGRSFCYRCWKLLPRGIQVDLYSRMGEGYEEAYDAAVKYLDEAGRLFE